MMIKVHVMISGHAIMKVLLMIKGHVMITGITGHVTGNGNVGART